MTTQRLAVVTVALLLLAVVGCGPSATVTKEITDNVVEVPVPGKVDSGTVHLLPYDSTSWSWTSPIYEGEAKIWRGWWNPTPEPPEATRDTLAAVRKELRIVLSKLNHLQGNVGRLTIERRPDTVRITERDTAVHYHPAPVIETPFWSKIGIGAIGGAIVLVLIAVVVIIVVIVRR